jgi:NAD-dependent dihydropyrimidine dehydrogenase PreA subunit
MRARPDGAGPLFFDTELCIGCNICVDVCQVDIMLPNPEIGLPPLVPFPEECWYDGSCVASCPVPGAIVLIGMPKDRVHFLRKETGEDFYT